MIETKPEQIYDSAEEALSVLNSLISYDETERELFVRNDEDRYYLDGTLVAVINTLYDFEGTSYSTLDIL